MKCLLGLILGHCPLHPHQHSTHVTNILVLSNCVYDDTITVCVLQVVQFPGKQFHFARMFTTLLPSSAVSVGSSIVGIRFLNHVVT